MLLAFAIVLFTVAVYMGLDAITVRQKQVAGSLARARRYGGAGLRDTELTRDVTNRLLAPAARKLADLATALPMTQNPDLIRVPEMVIGFRIEKPEPAVAQLRCALPATSVAPSLYPTLPDAGKIGAFKLLSIAGAYWKNDQSRKQLQRVD